MKAAPEAFEARLRKIGAERYHHRHPFHQRMHDGALSREELQTWVHNRFYYQTRIPVKDRLIIEKSTRSGFRSEWSVRLDDQCGREGSQGGLARWLDLAEAVGLERELVEGCRAVLPEVKLACDDYVRFVESHDLLESVAASLTEMFAGEIMRTRLAAFEEHYPWVGEAGLAYFRSRTVQAPRDAEFGLTYVVENVRTSEDQDRCAQALERKCEILWRVVDAIAAAQRRPSLSESALLRLDRTEGRWLVVLPERAIALNPSAQRILETCDGTRRVEELALEAMVRAGAGSTAYGDTHEFIAHMERLGALVTKP